MNNYEQITKDTDYLTKGANYNIKFNITDEMVNNGLSYLAESGESMLNMGSPGYALIGIGLMIPETLKDAYDGINAFHQGDYSSALKYGGLIFITGIESAQIRKGMKTQLDIGDEVPTKTLVEYGEHFDRKSPTKLKPKVETIDSNGYVFKTDNLGRIEETTALDLNLETSKRSLYKQRKAGGEDRLPGDQGGHGIGAQFNGLGGYDNLTAMSANVNLSEYKKLETQWADAKKLGKNVEVKIKYLYEGDSQRPAKYDIIYKIDGETNRVMIENK